MRNKKLKKNTQFFNRRIQKKLIKLTDILSDSFFEGSVREIISPQVRRKLQDNFE